ncbi:site-specific integrase [Proteiniphilum saccharofermentans]|uniref:tyrosine-type recombinase/integrase n=1 Tax=Proteiniphilum saccharofermentans TaxID=1642647 RepID=UPI0028B1A6D2|nr:site-specific integrase [Proteiniphilum saccharofermentans]
MFINIYFVSLLQQKPQQLTTIVADKYRIMRAYAKIYLDYRAKQDGLHNVKIRVTFGTRRKHYGTGFDLTPAEFDKIFYPKKKATLTKEQQETKIKLEAVLNKATDIIDKLDPFTYPDFEKYFLSSNDMFGSVKSAYDNYISNLDAEQAGTADSYRASITSLESYKKNLKFTDITPTFLKKYEKWMLTNGRSKTTVGMYLRALRAVFNQQDIDSKLYPFSRKANDKKYKIPKGRNIKKALTLDEIAKIFNYEAESDQEAKARDYWMFLYLCNGMNVKDFCSLKWNNIKGDTLQFEREKTKRTNEKPKTIVVSLKAETWDIINKWGVKSLVPDSYIFPHYDKKMTPERRHEIAQQLVKNINKYMKRIALKVGINKDVTTYFARHSFATILKRSGADIAMISDLLGHSDVSVTANYLDGFEDDQIKRQTDVLVSFDKLAQ